MSKVVHSPDKPCHAQVWIETNAEVKIDVQTFDFERKPRDFYPTPIEAVYPLYHTCQMDLVLQPCAGDGALVEHLETKGVSVPGDIEPQAEGIHKRSYDELSFDELIDSEV